MYASLARMSWRRYSERITAAAIALLLQTGLYLALSSRRPSLLRVTNAPTLEAMILTAARPNRETPPPPHASKRRMRSAVTQHPVVRPITAVEPQKKHATPSAIDWQAGIQREVGIELSRSDPGRKPKVRFGFPEMPAASGPASSFQWDEKRLDRVQKLAHGIINIGNCQIIIWFPIPMCNSQPADGDLFKNMYDRRNEEPGSLP